MVVGHNFDSEAGFERSSIRSGENMKGPTWRNLLTFLQSVDIAPERCFFTNVYRRAGTPETARWAHFLALVTDDFVQWCQRFLLLQFQLMQPRLVLSLGVYAPRFLARLSPELNRSWSRMRQFKTADEQGCGLVYPVTIEGVKEPVAAAALIHPSLRQRNARYRRYGKLEGDLAEQALVRDGMAKVGL